MEIYKKPTIAGDDSARNVFPAVAGALALGVTMGLARGKNVIDSNHTQALPNKKSVD